MKSVLLILSILFVFSPVPGEKLAEFPELINPSSFTHPLNINENHIYITDRIYVYIYSASDFKLVHRIGKAGEGPGEFIGFDNGKAVTGSLTSRHAVVSSVNKISFFNLDGIFKKEKKTANGFIFITFGDKFVGNTFETEGKTTYAALNIYDQNFTKMKELARFSQFSLRQRFSPFFIHRPKAVVYENKLYIDHPETGVIDVYDRHGEKISSISPRFEEIKITDRDKEEILDFYRSDIRIRQFFHQVKNLIQFPTYYPCIKTYFVSNNKIFILTYEKKNKLSRFLIYDLKGKLLKDLYFPLKHINFLETTPFTVHNGKIYQIVFDDDSEIWSLYSDTPK